MRYKLLVIVGETSTGKTQFAKSLFKNAATLFNLKIVLFWGG